MKKFLVGLVVLLLGAGAGWYIFGSKNQKVKVENAMPVPETSGIEETVVTTLPETGISSSVTYTDSGFLPKELTVKVGTTVTFTNSGNVSMWVASAPHPTHTDYPEFDQLKSVGGGGTYEFTFDKVGTWKYHNHIKASDFGTVVVTE